MNITTPHIKAITFLLAISCLFYTHYYLLHYSQFLKNDHGNHLEWPLFIDIFITIPILYWVIFRPPLNAFLLKTLILISLGILIGSLIIPEHSQQLWPYLTNLRYLLIFTLVVVELSLLVSLIHIIKNLSNETKNIETNISSYLAKKNISKALTELYMLEARIWLYAFFARNKKFYYEGKQHFHYTNYNGNASNQQGFIFIILFELPIVHFLLHFAWSPVAANWVTGLTLYGLIFMCADYKATKMRPISITDKELVIRYGVWGNVRIPISKIKSIKANHKSIKRSKQHLRFCQFGNPNICIELSSNTELQTAFSRSIKEKIYIGIDKPKLFLKELIND